jgi:F0F1-type ATP synthase assembly protein I
MIQAMGNYSYIGIFFGVAICLGVFAGRWADRRWHTGPWLELVGLGIGLASSFRELYRVSKKALREEER